MVAQALAIDARDALQRSATGQCPAEVRPDRLATPTKPATDQQQYRIIRLNNGMRVILVHDAAADKAAAAVDVRVGSLSDPRDLPGLAHFLEHMLFYSSERFPEEDAYSKFVTEHGGTTNAYTSAESTCYMFDVNSGALEATLQRFAQFFIAPIISVDGVDREVKAIDSEHGKNVNSDIWRQAQLWRGAANNAHPFSAFHTGNFETLMTRPKARGTNVQKAVKAFWERHYSADVMCAAIVAPHQLDDLESLAVAAFGNVLNRQLTPPVFSGDIFREEDKGILVKVVPEKDWHIVELQWAVPPEAPSYRSQPCGSLSHLLGHEGEGSIFAVLKARGLAVELSAGEGGLSFSGASLFCVTIVLTDAGYKRVDEVLALVMDYIRGVLTAAPVEKLLREGWEENAALAKLRFRFAERLPPLSSAPSLAHAMQEYPEQDLLLAMHHVALEFDPEAIAGVLACLTPRAVRIMWSSKAFEDDVTSVEYYYGARFSKERIPEEWLKRWEMPQPPSELHLPQPNSLISTEFELQEESWGRNSEPRLVRELALVSMWARPDTSFRLPRASIYVGFKSPAAYVDPEAAVMTKLFTRLLSDALNEVAYAASLAGLHYNVDSTVTGWLLSAAGYSHKVLHLVRLVINRMVALTLDPLRFEVVREALQRDFAAMAAHDQPYQRALYSTGFLLEAPKWHVTQYLRVLTEVTVADLKAFIPRLFSRVHATSYVTGNLAIPAAEELATDIQAALEQGASSRPPWSGQETLRRVVKLPVGRGVILREPAPNAANVNSAVAVSFQFGPDNMERNALGQLVAHLATRDAFAELRTRQQLGYIVHLAPWSTLTCRSLVILIQSTSFTAQHLSDAIERFLTTFWGRLSSLPQSEFQEQVAELAAAKLEAPQRLREVAARHWGELDGGTRVWNRPDAETDALKQLTLPQLQTFYKENVLASATRSMLSVQVCGATPKADSGSHGTANEVSASPAGNSEVASEISSQDRQPNGTDTADAGAATNASSLKSAAAAATTGDICIGLEDIWKFKRSQELYAAP